MKISIGCCPSYIFDLHTYYFIPTKEYHITSISLTMKSTYLSGDIGVFSGMYVLSLDQPTTSDLSIKRDEVVRTEGLIIVFVFCMTNIIETLEVSLRILKITASKNLSLKREEGRLVYGHRDCERDLHLINRVDRGLEIVTLSLSHLADIQYPNFYRYYFYSKSVVKG
jgi:hypothetical protein